MKRVSHLYEKMLNIDFIKDCIKQAARGKKRRKGVMKVLKDIDHHAELILEMVKAHSFKFLPTKTRIISEYTKKREITVSPFFPNQILDYMLVNSIKPLCKRFFYAYSVGNVDKKGITYGKEYLQGKIKKYKYFLKLDIHHFYQSVNTKILITLLEKRIKDKDFIGFCKENVLRFSFLPIGTYYSQWLSNYYLTEIDYFIKQYLAIPVYVRYVDDMLLLSNDCEYLAKCYFAIAEKLKSLELTLKKHESPKTTDRPISFLGFRFRKNKVFLRSRLYFRIRQTIKKVKNHLCIRLMRRLTAFLGWLKQYRKGYVFYKKKVMCIIKAGFIRRKISEANQSQTPRYVQWQEA